MNTNKINIQDVLREMRGYAAVIVTKSDALKWANAIEAATQEPVAWRNTRCPSIIVTNDKEPKFPDEWEPLFAFPLDAQAEIELLQETLKWYGEQARLARLIHSEGDAGRNALAADGGEKARTALAAKEVTP